MKILKVLFESRTYYVKEINLNSFHQATGELSRVAVSEFVVDNHGNLIKSAPVGAKDLVEVYLRYMYNF